MSKDGQLIWDHRRAAGKGRQASSGIEAEGAKRAESQPVTPKKNTSILVLLMAPVAPSPSNFTSLCH